MKKLLTLLMLVIVISAMAQQGKQQSYGSKSLAEVIVEWSNYSDTTFTLVILVNNDLLEVISLKHYTPYLKDVRKIAFRPGEKIIIPTSYYHDVFIKTKKGITAIGIERSKVTTKGFLFLNGKMLYKLDGTMHLVSQNLEDMEVDVNENTNWKWDPVYDKWVKLQQQSGTDYLKIK